MLWTDTGQGTVAHITQPCEKCGKMADQSVRRSQYYLVFWGWRTGGWVRLCSVGTTSHLECTTCGRLLSVKKQQVDDIHHRVAATSASQGGWYVGAPPQATHAYETT